MKTKTKIFIGLIVVILISLSVWFWRDQIGVFRGDVTETETTVEIELESSLNQDSVAPGELFELDLSIQSNQDLSEGVEVVTTFSSENVDFSEWEIYSKQDFEITQSATVLSVSQKITEVEAEEALERTYFILPDKFNDEDPCASYEVKIESEIIEQEEEISDTETLIVDPENIPNTTTETSSGGITLQPGETATITYNFSPSEKEPGAIMNKAAVAENVQACHLALVKPILACLDGEDNDGDGLVDLKDSDCSSPYDDTEYGQDFELTIAADPQTIENGKVTNTISIERLNDSISTAELSLNINDISHLAITPNTTKLNDELVADLTAPLALDFSDQDEYLITVEKEANNDGLKSTTTLNIKETITLAYELNGEDKEQSAATTVQVKYITPTAISNGGGGGGHRSGGGGGSTYTTKKKSDSKVSGESICTIVKPEWKDTDGDGLSDDLEKFLGSDPQEIDTDEDGYADGTEYFNNYNYLTKNAKRIWSDLDEEWQVNAVAGFYPVILAGIKAPEDSLAQFNAIIESEQSNQFNPNRLANRAEVAYMLFQRIEVLCEEDIVFDPPPFPDVDEDDYFYEAIGFLYEQEVLNGYDDGFFRPSRMINRAEVAKLIANTFGIKVEDIEQIKGQKFEDVQLSDWFASFVNSLRVQEITKGYRDLGDNLYRPAEPITRAEIAELIRKAAAVAEKKYLGVSLEEEIRTNLEATAGKLN